MKLEHLRFSYEGKCIFSDFSLSLPDSGVIALSGASGQGKTTLLRLIAGLETPQSGAITGVSSTSFLFQENRLLPGLNCGEQICAVLPHHSDPKPWLDAVGLGAESCSPVDALSGGMQRRLALARCLAYGQDKQWLLLDEPFTGVDPQRIASLMDFIRAQQKPVLFSAHDAYSLSLADSIVRLD
jgi:ABC-type nitrate/sulfonate/bicarbonate transport system ATPase subunit